MRVDLGRGGSMPELSPDPVSLQSATKPRCASEKQAVGLRQRLVRDRHVHGGDHRQLADLPYLRRAAMRQSEFLRSMPCR